MLRFFTAVAVASGLAIAAASPVLAQKGNTNSNGVNTIDRDKGLGRAQDRNEAQTPNRNSNGVNAIDRDKGPARAGDRNDKR
jgi:hypothetical protein